MVACEACEGSNVIRNDLCTSRWTFLIDLSSTLATTSPSHGSPSRILSASSTNGAPSTRSEEQRKESSIYKYSRFVSTHATPGYHSVFYRIRVRSWGAQTLIPMAKSGHCLPSLPSQPQSLTASRSIRMLLSRLMLLGDHSAVRVCCATTSTSRRVLPQTRVA